mmetsp:Transcript_19489/g.48194  ORF Transcript_19489/g.48194 Transcript_19489/m.48194 type:complete len:83 (+) Transcript_19489:105-353(+)|eukprot:CAMPEP_0181384246 /NCGR_PEP_ID=MMETSP1106-20121128/21846_1 /TAXON_ID=81844 /ORGANISM="Mantoniella antarctica, Strain SL-175" /LENGTH=82 /DNA_ID=CAMNT_0023504071 /DNA_START=330 /DNA_END=578 /DNA_ORIENTATION=+
MPTVTAPMTSMKATDNSASSTMEGSGGDLSGGGMGGGMGVGVGVGGGGGLRRVSAAAEADAAARRRAAKPSNHRAEARRIKG